MNGIGRRHAALSCAAVCAVSSGWVLLLLEHRHTLEPGPVIGGLLVCWWLIALTMYDLTCRRLPNLLTLPGAVATTSVLAVLGHGRAAVMGAAILTFVYLVVHLSIPASLGAGDVKLAWTIGALTGAAGPAAWTHAALLAPVLTAVVGIALWLGDRTDRAVPHGPSMCAATLLVLSTSST